MANIIVRKPMGNDRDGMIDAGGEINTLLCTIASETNNGVKQGLANNFFNDLWSNLGGKDGAPPDSPDHEFFLQLPGTDPDTASDDIELRIFRTSGNQYATYENVSGVWTEENKFNPKTEFDQTAGNGTRRMTISIPEDAKNLTGEDSYLSGIINNLGVILREPDPDGDGDEDDEALRLVNARKYLLAVVFLNRCQ